MKRIAQKKLRRLEELQELGQTLVEEYEQNSKDLQQKYNISDSHFDYKFEEWTENDHNFADESEELYAEFEHTQRVLDAKLAAKFLIATNIARRGKLLHPDTAVRKLKKYGKDGKYVIDMISSPVLPMVFNSEPYLARELYNSFHVTLMDAHLLRCLLTEMHNHTYIFPDEYRKKRFNHCKNFVKKFHKCVINSVKQKAI